MPAQESLYLKEDYKTLERKAFTFSVWALVLFTGVATVIALKDVKQPSRLARFVLGIAGVSLSLWFLTKPIVLSGFSLVNKLHSQNSLVRNYRVVSVDGEENKDRMIFLSDGTHIFLIDNVVNANRLKRSKSGDTVVLQFKNGLLNVPFEPKVKE